MEKTRNKYKILVVKPLGKRLLEKLKRRFKGNIKVDHREIDWLIEDTGSGQKLLEWYPVADSVTSDAESLGCATRMLIMQTAFSEPLFHKQTGTLTS